MNSVVELSAKPKKIHLSEDYFHEVIKELENAASIIAQQKVEIETLQGSLRYNEAELKALQEHQKELKKENKKTLMENQKITNSLQGEIDNLKLELEHTQKQVGVWKTRACELQQSLKKFLDSAIMDGGNETSGIDHTYINNYEDTILNLRNQLDERLIRIESLELKIQNCEMENNDLNNELANLKSKNKLIEYELRGLKERSRKEENEKRRLQYRERNLSQEVANLQRKISNKVEELQKEKTILNEQIWDLEQRLKETEVENNKYITNRNFELAVRNNINYIKTSLIEQIRKLQKFVQFLYSHKKDFISDENLDFMNYGIRTLTKLSPENLDNEDMSVQIQNVDTYKNYDSYDTFHLHEIQKDKDDKSFYKWDFNDASHDNNYQVQSMLLKKQKYTKDFNEVFTTDSTSKSNLIYSKDNLLTHKVNKSKFNNELRTFNIEEMSPSLFELARETINVLGEVSNEHQDLIDELQLVFNDDGYINQNSCRSETCSQSSLISFLSE
ncbi:uncharacterized protein CMU_021320 [Cryptosporidium muris RN66]|uniref:Uncharacterized protein n=1 Tax=Cryptosporidium muris (strain RN66) TaxID=441375 RepID=B6AJH8_CRYMR|nr:uncharacterized protein CMU_021320 [Cryptosporidium muris RN66]EEA08369.1 hypothetical protein, conserved [Cryptosporidium muris RN66]|eukprot:XP_002142718.1 hypothetical protein [Cryptosporidium muris RN66]